MSETRVDVAEQVDLLPGTELLPDVKYEMVTYEQSKPDEQARVDRLMDELSLIHI